ncbi:MAG: FAD-dependent monooxygenase [Legionella sp.]|nr:FAD-dependent monooxygenase [Legionella sp.]
MHYKVVIIGAGPIGLYLANKLHKAGVQSMTVFDPRADTYTRPGHVNPSVMAKIRGELGQAPIAQVSKPDHIKDVERALYAKNMQLQITIEKKNFVRFNNDPKNKGVIVADADGTEQLVQCDYVFDCTGSKRTLVTQLNAIVSPSPFTIRPISSKINVKNHLLAYVKINSADFQDTYKMDYTPPSPNPTPEAAFAYAQNIEKLRTFGWHEFGFPRSYAQSFKNQKACFYLECPDNLPTDQQIPWLQTVLDTKLQGRTASFSQLPPSRKYKTKPRVSAFQVDPQVLQQATYQAPGLPTLIVAGDAQIDPNYVLAHGLETGMSRVDQFIQHIETYNGSIAYFDAEDYLNLISGALKKQQEEITDVYKKRSDYFQSWFLAAHSYYQLAIQKAAHQPELIKQFSNTLLEIEILEVCARLHMALSLYHNKEGIISIDDTNAKSVDNTLFPIQVYLIKLGINVPNILESTREKFLNQIFAIAGVWKDLGGYYFKKQSMRQAVDMYQRAQQLYQGQPEYALQILTLASNIVICQRKLNDNDEAIATAQKVLAQYKTTPVLAVIKNKIMYNLILAVTDKLNTLSKNEATPFIHGMQKLFAQHAELLDEKMMRDVEKITGNPIENKASGLGFFENKSPKSAEIKPQIPPLSFMN